MWSKEGNNAEAVVITDVILRRKQLLLVCGFFLSHTGKIKTEFTLEFFDALENLFQHGLLDTG